MLEPLRVVVVGPGWIAQRHFGAIASEPGVHLVGIVGHSLASAQRAVQAYGGRPYDDVRAMLDAEQPDAAILCVPPDAHGELEAAFLERGVHLMIEKPLAGDKATPEQIAQMARASGAIVGVAYHWRALDTIPGVVEALAERPPRLVVGAWHDALPGPAWWRDESRGGGQIVEQATHLVDLARRLVGEAHPLHATMDYEAEPSTPGMTAAVASTATLRFDTGAVGALTTTCKLAGPSTAELKLLADGLAVTIRQDGVLYEEAAPGGVHSRFVSCTNDPIRDEDRAFFAAIRAGDPSLLFSTYDDALRTHRLTIAIRELATGR